MDTVEKFLEWINHITMILDGLKHNKPTVTGVNKGKAARYDDESKNKLEIVIEQIAATLVKFHSDSSELEKKDLKVKAAREIVFAAVGILRKVDIDYSSVDSANDLITGLQNFLLYLISALGGNWENPTSSILILDLDSGIVKRLFYDNGVATIGQLIRVVSLDEKLVVIGDARMGKIITALNNWDRKNRQNNSVIRKPVELQSNSHGVWTLMEKDFPEYFIELNAAQVLTIANHCSIRVTADGKVIAKLESPSFD